MIVVSACLVGKNCKYNGENNRCENIIEYLEDKEYVLVCPEQMGGLETPRVPAEIISGNGDDVLDGNARVLNRDGADVTEQYVLGAQAVGEIAQKVCADKAILKESSPSCGVNLIYDGSFKGNKKRGCGVTAAILKKQGLHILSEKDFEK